MCFTFVDFDVNTFTFVLIMLEIVDREIKGITSKIFVIYNVYVRKVFYIFFLDDVNEYYSLKKFITEI